MKRILALITLLAFNFCFFISPSYAIIEKDYYKNQSILDYINFDWWKKQNDPYLEKYIVSAINNNYDIKTAALKIEEAKINIQATKSNLMPSVSIGASPAMSKFPSSTQSEGSFALPIIAQWELDLFGKNYDKTKSAKKIYKSAQFQAQASDISIVSMVGAAYYNIVKLDKLIEIQKNLVDDRKEIYDLMKISNEEGIVSTSDLIQAEKSFVMSQNELIDYEKSRQNALSALAVLIGDSPNNINEYQRISADELGNNFSIPNEISSEIITNRPDYKAVENQLEAVGFDVRAAKKEFLPTINILGVLTFLTTNAFGKFNFENALALLAPSATLPIFTGLKRVANVKINKNKYEQILQQYQKTNLVAIQEVNDALYNYKSDNEKLLNNIKALEIQKKDYDYSKMKFNQGVISKLDLLQQKETLLYMQKMELNSKTDCYIDKISLYKTTGARV